MTGKRLAGVVVSMLAVAVLSAGCGGEQASPAGGSGGQEPMRQTQTPMQDDDGMQRDRMHRGERGDMHDGGHMRGDDEEPM